MSATTFSPAQIIKEMGLPPGTPLVKALVLSPTGVMHTDTAMAAAFSAGYSDAAAGVRTGKPDDPHLAEAYWAGADHFAMEGMDDA